MGGDAAEGSADVGGVEGGSDGGGEDQAVFLPRGAGSGAVLVLALAVLA